MSTASPEDFVHAGRGNGRQAPEDRLRPCATDAAEGTFVKVAADEHPLPLACEVAVYLQDYHRSSSKLGRFGKIVGIDQEGREYLVMLDNFECLAVPMRRAEWRKVAT
jgi:hypothetical protein